MSETVRALLCAVCRDLRPMDSMRVDKHGTWRCKEKCK